MDRILGADLPVSGDRAAYLKDWKKRNPDKMLEYGRRYRARHPETGRKAAIKYKSANIELVRERDRALHQKRRLLNPEQQAAATNRARKKKIARQILAAGREKPEVCELCHEFHLRIVFDHNHSTNEFRGWLCDRCNKVLGLVHDNPNLLVNLSGYLKTNGIKNVNTINLPAEQAQIQYVWPSIGTQISN